MPEQLLPFRDLIDSGLPGTDTVKQIVPSSPDLIIRHNPLRKFTYQDAITGKRELAALQRYGIHLPMIDMVYVEGCNSGIGQIYTIVERVKGVTLNKALRTPSDEFIEKYQMLYIGLTHYLVDRAKPGSVHFKNLIGHSNFVYGTSRGTTTPEIYPVDVELWFAGFEKARGNPLYHAWLRRLGDIVADIIRAEAISKIRLPKARKAVGSVLESLIAK